jgi:hypothetical protein
MASLRYRNEKWQVQVRAATVTHLSQNRFDPKPMLSDGHGI